MKRIEITKDIVCYEDFLLKEELDYIYNRATSSSQEEWDTQYHKEMEEAAEHSGYVTTEEKDNYFKNINKKNPYWENKLLKINNPAMSYDINERILEIYSRDKYKTNFPESIQRQYSGGEELKVHYDAIHNPSIKYAIVIYLNDDYNGGELFFPQHDLEIKPKAGSLMTFPGTEDFKHGTKKVHGTKDRFVIACFVFEKD